MLSCVFYRGSLGNRATSGVRTKTNTYWQRFLRALLAFSVTIAAVFPPASIPASAASGDRTLYLYYTHTRETAKITFKRNGRYDSKGLAQLNQFLRDWRRNEPTKMDPALFDLVWEVYQESGATKPINVVSAYRAPATNEMLRSKSSAVAKNSQHTHGQAMDFFIPGVSISKLRQIAMKKQVGGVGYYPTSGSPFVHLDTGNVRAWPRMTKAQLEKIFPDGKTLHIPTNGVPLSNSGYHFAKAQWIKCRTVPCNGRSGSSIRLASANDKDDGKPKQTLLGWMFGNDEDEGEEEGNVVTAVASAPARTVAKSIPASAPVPASRPLFAGTLVADAPFPAARPRGLFTTTPAPAEYNGAAGTIAVASLQDAPAPRTLMSQPAERANSLVAAYAPANAPVLDAQQAVQALIERNSAVPATSANAKQPAIARPASTDAIRTASVTNSGEFDALGSLIESTWTAVTQNGAPKMLAQAKAVQLPIETRQGVFHAPDLDHVTEIFADPAPMSSQRYAVIFEHDEADFDPATEIGRQTNKASFDADTAWGLDSHRFLPKPPLLVASR